MPPFTVNPHRADPYKDHRFRVRWDGRYVAGLSEMSALVRTTEVVKHRDGGSPATSRRSPGLTEFQPIRLARGVTHDNEFERWANKVWKLGNGLGAEVSLGDFRKDIVIELHNEAGQVALAYKVYRCWVSEFAALPELDANRGAVAIEHIVLQHEGWERDLAVTEPVEPTFEDPVVKPADKPAEKPAEKPAGKPAKRATKKSAGS